MRRERDLHFVASLRAPNGLVQVLAMSPRELERVRNALRRDLGGSLARQRGIAALLDYIDTRLMYAAPRSGHPTLWPAMKGKA